MTETEFFSPNCDDAALTRIDAIMAHGSCKLMMAICYVTDYGVTELLNRHTRHLMKDGSFIVVGDSWDNSVFGPAALISGGVVGYFGVVVNTPRKLHSAGPTNRDYPRVDPNVVA